MTIPSRALLSILSLSSLVFATEAGAAAAPARVFTVVEHAKSDTVTDTGAKGDSVGDVMTFNNAVFDAANKREVGRSNGWCIRTVVGKTWECSWTNIFKDGQVVVQGPFAEGADTMLAATGGTGAYANIRGQMRIHARDPKGAEYDFAFNLQ